MTSAWAWFSAPWAAALTLALLHFLWLGALWTALGDIAVRCLGATSPSRRYAIWLSILALMAASPVVTVWWLQPTETSDGLIAASLSNVAAATAEPSIAAFPSFDILLRWQPYLLLGWLAGVLVCGLRLVLSTCWVVHVTQRLSDWPDAWHTRAQRLGHLLGMHNLPRLGLSPLISEPMAVRLWRPAIVFPASWLSEIPAEMIEAVIAHELAHIRRHDLWINLLQRAIETLLFFHPCVWWVSRQVRHERELCCDALAVSATGRVLEYARALEWVASWRLASAGPLLATGLGGTRMALLQRVRQVLGLDAAEAASGGWTWGATGVGALAVCATALLLWSAPVQGDDEPSSATDPANVGSFDQALRALDSVLAQRGDDEDRPPPRREPPRDGERRPDAGPRDGDRRPEGPRDGERRPEGPRDGERPREAGPRDGERRPEAGPRDGERRPDGPREGERRPDGPPRGERGPQSSMREGDRRPEFGPREGGPRPEFRDVPPDALRDMMRAMQELREEVQRLRAEVNELRAQRGGPPFGREGGPRPDFRPEFREEPLPRPREGRPDGERGREDGRPGPRPEGRDGDPRGRGEVGRPGPDGRPRPESERRPDGERDREGPPR